MDGGELGPVQLTVGLLDPFVGKSARSMTKLKQYGVGRDVDYSSCYSGLKCRQSLPPSQVWRSSVSLISRHGGGSI